MSDFDKLPDESRVWVFALKNEAGAADGEALKNGLAELVGSWKSHGDEVSGAFGILYERFIIVASDPSTMVSGCSIDSIFRGVKQAVENAKLELADSSNIFFREGDAVRESARAEFRELVASGKVSAETIVFDNTIENIGQWRAGKWELPLRSSWHARAFPLP